MKHLFNTADTLAGLVVVAVVVTVIVMYSLVESANTALESEHRRNHHIIVDSQDLTNEYQVKYGGDAVSPGVDGDDIAFQLTSEK